VPDMQNIDWLVVHAAENLKRIADDGRDTYLSPLGHACRCFWVSRDEDNSAKQLAANRFCDGMAAVSLVVGRDLVEVGEGSLQIDNLMPSGIFRIPSLLTLLLRIHRDQQSSLRHQ
jgi:hypothetical protein